MFRKNEIKILFLIPCIFLVFITINERVFAQTTESNTAKAIVGKGSNQPPINISSCPLSGGRTIRCGSFMSDPRYNGPACSGPDPTYRGHCGKTYGNGFCYRGSIEATNNERRAHSIDVSASVGETVYLPTIDNQTVNWIHGATFQIEDFNGGGFGHTFITHLGSDTWTMYLIHANQSLISPPAGSNNYKSGDAVTTVNKGTINYTHLHINIGKNTISANGGPGWLNPEDIGMCI